MELWIKGPAGTSFPFGYRTRSEVEIRTNWWLSVPRSNQCADITSLYPWVNKKIARQKWKQGVCLLNLYGWRKEHWTKGAAGTGSVDQQAVERHW